MIMSSSLLLRMRNVSDKSCRENKNTSYVQKLFSENRAVCDIMWKHYRATDKMAHAHSILDTKTINTHSEYALLIGRQ